MSQCLDCRLISIPDLVAKGLFDGQGSFSWNWRHSGEMNDHSLVIHKDENDPNRLEFEYKLWGKQYSYKVRIVERTMHFGGFRRYFVCPLQSNGIACGRIASKLFKPKGEEFYGCSRCHKVRYMTQIWNKKSSLYQNARAQMLDARLEKLVFNNNRTKFYKGKKTKRWSKIEYLEKQLELLPAPF